MRTNLQEALQELGLTGVVQSPSDFGYCVENYRKVKIEETAIRLCNTDELRTLIQERFCEHYPDSEIARNAAEGDQPPQKILKQDLVIPAGTVFDEAPAKTERHGRHVCADVALTNDMTANVSVPLEDGDEDYWFDAATCGNCAHWNQNDEQYGQCDKDDRYYSKDAVACEDASYNQSHYSNERRCCYFPGCNNPANRRLEHRCNSDSLVLHLCERCAHAITNATVYDTENDTPKIYQPRDPEARHQEAEARRAEAEADIAELQRKRHSLVLYCERLDATRETKQTIRENDL